MTAQNKFEKEKHMTEEKNINQTKEQSAEENQLGEITIPVKFNGEIKNLTVGEASLLAQKGMKFDSIKNDFEEIKKIARTHGKSVPEFIQAMKQNQSESRKKELLEKCGGDTELVEKITALEEKDSEINTDSFNEVKEFFPEIQNVEALPEQVVENARLKGTLLLDEYLRYLLAQKRRQEKSIKSQAEAEKLSIGSQFNQNAPVSPEGEEFIKGLWK